MAFVNGKNCMYKNTSTYDVHFHSPTTAAVFVFCDSNPPETVGVIGVEEACGLSVNPLYKKDYIQFSHETFFFK